MTSKELHTTNLHPLKVKGEKAKMTKINNPPKARKAKASHIKTTTDNMTTGGIHPRTQTDNGPLRTPKANGTLLTIKDNGQTMVKEKILKAKAKAEDEDGPAETSPVTTMVLTPTFTKI